MNKIDAEKIKVKIVCEDGVTPPRYESAGAAGMDLRAHITEPIILGSLERTLVPTGIKIAIPEGCEVQIRPRSGLALKHGITCLNTPGTIDSDYRGEIKVILANLGKEPFTINPDDRICQMVLNKVAQIDWDIISDEELDETSRGTGGFGHTGTN